MQINILFFIPANKHKNSQVFRVCSQFNTIMSFKLILVKSLSVGVVC